jgi:6-pyruvoyltetrahydropterin/6-carboxytetrahydropterin synthase
LSYLVSVIRHFDAAHFLRGYTGKCEALHGHRYQVRLCLKREELDNLGMAFDFTLLKKELDTVLTKYDHHCLNDISPFDNINPSAENIARIVYKSLQPKMENGTGKITEIEVWESPDSSATFVPD